jgi:hypothetical protein
MGVSLTGAGKIRCPACGYPVFALPAVCVCPECGVACDPHAKVYVIQHPAHHLMWAISIWIFVLAVTFTLFRGTRDGPWVLTMIGAAFLLTIVQLYRFLRSIGLPHRVLVNHKGIRFEHPYLDPQVIEWSHFEEARWCWFTGRLNVTDKSGQPMLCRRYRRVGGWRRTRQLAEVFNRLAERYVQENL